MKKLSLFGAVGVLIAAGVFAVNASVFAASLTVDNSGSCDNTTGSPAYCTVQAAVDHATSGDTITVAAGTYDAFQVVGKTNLTIKGAGTGSSGTIIKPSALITTGVGHKYTANMLASVFVNQSSGVTIKSMAIEDNGQTPGSGGPDAIVFWNASSGTLQSVKVQGTYVINGVQSGQGIAVDAGTGQVSNLAVKSVTIKGFQKNAIDAIDGNGNTSNPGVVTLTVTNGSIVGAGATSTIAQNGILIWNRGGGTVTGSVNGTDISKLQYTGADQDVGVYAYGGASFTNVSNVTFKTTDLYINAGTSGTAIDATTGNTFDGVSPGSATGAQLAAIENKLYGRMEDATADKIYIFPNTFIVTLANRGIQAGLNEAASGQTVVVTPGTYVGDLIVPTSHLTLQGIDGPVITLGSGYGINLDNPPMTPTNFTMSGFTVNASSGTTYALKVYKADGLSLTDVTFNGAGGGTHDGGIDINTTSNVSLTNVTANGFYKNGFADTAAYTAADSTTSGNTITFTDVTATNNGWNGIAFYTTGNAGGGASIHGVTFAGTNTVSGNGTTGLTQGGIFIEGDTDTNVGIGNTPTYTVTTDGTTLDLTHVVFGSNNAPWDILNYQTAPVNAIGATFGGVTGDAMTNAQIVTEDGRIYDLLDKGSLGLVTYYTPLTAPTLISPTNGAVIPGASVTNSWSAVTHAATYEYQSYNDAAGTSLRFDGTYATTSKTATNVADGTVFYWRVRGLDPEGNPGPWSNSGNLWKVTISNAPPADVTPPSVPTLTAPTNSNTITTNDFYFTWGASTDDRGGAVTYQFHSSLDGTQSSGVLTNGLWTSGTLTDPTIHSTGAPDGTWYWQVRAQDDSGNWSNWSDIWSVTIDTTPHLTITAPATSGTTVSGVYTFGASYTNGVTTNIQWAVRKGSSCSGTGNTVAGNVDGHSDTSTLTGSIFAAQLDTTAWDNGQYCLVVNPAEPSGHGYADLRATQLFVVNNVAPPSVTTNAATNVTGLDATLNATNGPVDADAESFWVSMTSGIDTSSANIPSGVYSTPVLAAVASSTSFSDPLSLVTTNGIITGGASSNMPAITSGTTYYYVAWVHVGGIWYHGAEQSVTTAVDGTTPVLTLIGNNPVHIKKGATYIDPGVTISDTPTDNLGYTIATDGAATTSSNTFSLDTSTEGTHVLTYSATDGGGNTGTVTRTVMVDGTSPTVVLSSDSSDPTTDNPIHVTATFSEEVTGFDQTDIAASSASISNFQASSTDPLVYTFDVIPTGSSITVSVAEHKYTDLAGNENQSQADFSRTIGSNTPQNTAPTGSGSNGGGGGGNGSPSIFGLTVGGGLVLGTSTVNDTNQSSGSCNPLITTFMGLGRTNDAGQVKALQTFLNGEMSSKLPVSGFFGLMTDQVVKQFQVKYKNDILSPWGLTDPTGYVYTYTQKKINEIHCAQ